VRKTVVSSSQKREIFTSLASISRKAAISITPRCPGKSSVLVASSLFSVGCVVTMLSVRAKQFGVGVRTVAAKLAVVNPKIIFIRLL
jgi:hypothetical protein